MSTTRSKDLCPVFGSPKSFKDNVLPTYSDIISYYLIIRNNFWRDSKQEPSLADISLVLIKDLKVLWAKRSLSVVSDQQILHKIREYRGGGSLSSIVGGSRGLRSCYFWFTCMYLECGRGLTRPSRIWRYRLTGFSSVSGGLSPI